MKDWPECNIQQACFRKHPFVYDKRAQSQMRGISKRCVVTGCRRFWTYPSLWVMKLGIWCFSVNLRWTNGTKYVTPQEWRVRRSRLWKSLTPGLWRHENCLSSQNYFQKRAGRRTRRVHHWMLQKGVIIKKCSVAKCCGQRKYTFEQEWDRVYLTLLPTDFTTGMMPSGSGSSKTWGRKRNDEETQTNILRKGVTRALCNFIRRS